MAPGQSGFPRNLGTPVVSTGMSAWWVAEPRRTQAAGPASGAERSEPETHHVVLPSEGNEARREGRQVS